MAGSIIGKVSVKVWPDTRGFKKEAEAGLKGQEPSDIDVGVDADVKKALAKIEALEKKIKDSVTVDVDASTAGAAAKAKALKEGIERDEARLKVKADVDKALANAQRDFEKFHALTVRVKPVMSKDAIRSVRRDMDVLLHKRERLQMKIDVETDKFKIVELKRDLHDVERSIKTINRDFDRMATGTHRAHDGFVRVERSVGRIQKGISRAFGEGSRNNFLNSFGRMMGRLSLALAAPILTVNALGRAITDGIGKFRDLAAEGVGTGKALVGGLGAAFSSVTQSITSIVAAIIGAVIAFGSIAAVVPIVTMLAGAITALVGTISIGLIGSLIPLIPLLVAMGAGVAVAGGAIWALSDDIKKGTGHFAAAKRELGGLEKAIRDVGRKAAPALGSIAATMVRGATRITKSMSGAVNAIFRDFDREIKSPKMDKFYDQWANKMPGIVSKFGQGLTSLGVGLVAFFTPALDIADDLAQKFKNAMDRFKEWSQSASGQNTIAAFFEKAWDRAKTLWSVIKHLSKAIANIFTAGDKGAGKGFLESWEKSLEKFEKWTANPKNLEKFFEDVKAFGTDLKDITKNVADFFEELNKPENRKRVLELVDAFNKLLTGLEFVASVAEGALIPILGLIDLFGQVKKFLEGGGLGGDDLLPGWLKGDINLDGMKNLGPRIMGFLNQIIPQVGAWAMQMTMTFTTGIAGWIGQITVAMGLVAQAILGPLVGLGALVFQSLIGTGMTIFTTITGWAIQAGAGMLMVVQSILTPLLTLPFQIMGTLVGVGVNIFTTIAGWAGQAAMAMFTVVQSIITPLMNLPGRAGMALAGMGIAIVGRIAGIAGQAGVAAAGIGIRIIGALISIPGRAAATLAGLGPRIAGAIASAAGSAAGAAAGLVARVIGVLTTLPSRSGSTVGGMSGTVAAAIGRAAVSAAGATAGLVARVVGILATLPSRGAGAIAGLVGTLVGVVSRAAGAVAGQCASLVMRAVGALRPLPGLAMAAISALPSLLVGVAQRAMTGMAGAVASGVVRAVAAIRTLPGKFVSALSGLPGRMRSIGADIVNGLVGGINSKIGAASAAASKLGGIVKSVASMRLEVRSPSRVFMRIGEFVVEGLAKGMSKTRAAEKAASNLGQSALDATNKTLEIHSPSRAFMRSGTNTVKGLTKGVKKQSKVDRRPMIAAARRMMNSFSTGLYSQARNIRNYLGSLIREIPKMTNVMARKWSMNLAKQLKSSLTQWERLRDSYNEWRDKMAELVKARDDFAAGMVSNALDIAGLGNIEGGFDEVIHRLTTAKRMTDEFAKHLATLRKNGLREDLYEDIASMGAEQGLAAAKAIAEAGKKGVQQVNALQKDLLKSSSKVANKSANHLYGAGLEMATSIAEGFASEMNAVERRMVKMARDLAININRELRTNGVRPVVEMPSVANRGAGSRGSYSESLNSGSTRILNYYAAPGSAKSTEQELFKAFKKAGF